MENILKISQAIFHLILLLPFTILVINIYLNWTKNIQPSNMKIFILILIGILLILTNF